MNENNSGLIERILEELDCKKFMDLAEKFKKGFSECTEGAELGIIVDYILELDTVMKATKKRLEEYYSENYSRFSANEKNEINRIKTVAEEQKKLAEKANLDKHNECSNRLAQAKKEVDAVKADAIMDIQIEAITEKKGIMSFFKRDEEQAKREERIKKVEQDKENIYRQIVNEINQQLARADKLLQEQIEEIKIKTEDEIREKRGFYRTRMQALEEATEKIREKLLDIYLEESIKEFFDCNDFEEKINAIGKAIAVYGAYEGNPERLPEYYYVQDLFYQFEAEQLYLIGQIRKVSTNVQKYKFLDDKGTISLPQVIQRENGFRLHVEMDATTQGEEIREFILRQFTGFPAGKMEAVFIAPQANPVFSMFTKLGGDDYKQLFDTKIWGSKADIQDALKRARGRLETLSSSYGIAKLKAAEREERENFRLIAIADFPNDFTNEALAELETLVKMGPEYGINVITFGTSAERKAAVTNQQGVVERILSLMDKVKKIDGSYVYSTGEKSNIKINVPLKCRWKKGVSYEDKEKLITKIASHVGDYKMVEVTPDDIYDDKNDVNYWLVKSSKEGIVLPIGTRGDGEIVNLTLGRKGTDIRHHVLVEGNPGAGKSTFLHTLICSTIRLYAPDEVQLYLLDYKQGVEFQTYTNYDLPSFRVLSVQSERTYGARILKQLVELMNDRFSMFKTALPDYPEPDIEDYRNRMVDKGGKSVPRILMIIDEFEGLTAVSDDITVSVMNSIKALVKQGRAAGIHVIIASQTLDLPNDIAHNLAVRIALKGSEHLLDSNDDLEQLRNSADGTAVFNDDRGNPKHNLIFQIANIKNEEKKEMLQCLSQIESDVAYRNGSSETQILHTKIEENRKLAINQFAIQGILPEEPLAKKESTYPIQVGNSFDLDEELVVSLRCAKGSNMLISCENERIARVLFEHTLVSILFDDLCRNNLNQRITDSSRQFIYLIDFGDPVKRANNVVSQMLKKKLSNQIAFVDVDDSDEDELDDFIDRSAEYIDVLYRKIVDSKKGKNNLSRDFLFIFGINRAHLLKNIETSNVGAYAIYESSDIEEGKSCFDKLKVIYEDGPQYGINCIFWSDNYSVSETLLGDNFETKFSQKIVAHMSDEDTKKLVMEKSCDGLGDMGAIYLGRQASNNKFRIYDGLSEKFTERFIEKYVEKTNVDG